MTNVSSVSFAETPAVAAEAASRKSAEDAAVPFDSFLTGRASEPSLRAQQGAAKDAPTAVEERTKEQAAEDDKKNADDADRKDKANAQALNSCLAGWQILPPPVPVQPAPMGPNATGKTIDPNSSADESSQTTVAKAATDSKAEPAVPAAAAPTPDDPIPKIAPATSDNSGQPKEESAAGQLTPSVAVPGTPAAALPAQADMGEASKTGEAAKAVEIKGSRALAATAEVPHPTLDGIPVAKEQRAMSATTFHHQAKPAPAAFAESETPSKVPAESGLQAVAGVKASEPTRQDDSQAGMSNGQHEPAGAEAFTLPAGAEVSRGAEAPKEDTKVTASDTAQAIHDIERAIDRMRTQGSQRMEMRLPMRDGEEVVVKLRLEQGEVKATFQSGSEGLRQALETGWSQYTQNSAERAAKAAPAVFESPSMQSGMGGFHQSPEQRQREDSARSYDPDFATPLSPPENQKTIDLRSTPAAPTPSTSLEIYA